MQSSLFANSIFSKYGWVEEDFGMDIYSQGMGEIGIADINRNNLGIANPALLTTANKSIFSTSFKFGYDYYDDGEDKYKDKSAYFPYASLIIPVNKSNFLGLGFSQRFHNYLENCRYYRGDFDYQNYKETSLFDGSISCVGIAYAHKYNLSGNRLNLSGNWQISFGFGFNYYFGQNTKEREIDFTDNSFIDYRENVRSKFDGCNFLFGFTTKISRLTIGGFFENKAKLNSNYSHHLIFTSYEEHWADEELPTQLGGGINYQITEDFSIETDYRISLWKDIKSKNSEAKLDRNSQFIALGISYLPSYSDKFYRKTSLRAGFYYKQLPFTSDNSYVNEMAVTCGFDVPIKARLLGKLSVAFQYGIRGTVRDNGYSDHFVKFSIGIFAGDEWKKRRRRIDREIPQIDPKYEVEEF